MHAWLISPDRAAWCLVFIEIAQHQLVEFVFLNMHACANNVSFHRDYHILKCTLHDTNFLKSILTLLTKNLPGLIGSVVSPILRLPVISSCLNFAIFN